MSRICSKSILQQEKRININMPLKKCPKTRMPKQHKDLRPLIYLSILQHPIRLSSQASTTKKDTLWYFQADFLIVHHSFPESCQTNTDYHSHKDIFWKLLGGAVFTLFLSHKLSELSLVPLECIPFPPGNLDYILSHKMH